MNSATTTERQRNRLLVIVVAVVVSLQFVDSVLLAGSDIPVVLEFTTGLAVVGMLTGAAWLTVCWIRDR